MNSANAIVGSILIGALLLHGIFPPDAQGVVVCQRGSHAKLRPEACKPKETRLALDADSLGGATVDDLAAMRCLSVRDANGALMGSVIGLDGANILVTRQVDLPNRLSGWVIFAVNRFGVADTGIPYLSIDPQCLGPNPFLRDAGNSFARRLWVSASQVAYSFDPLDSAGTYYAIVPGVPADECTASGGTPAGSGCCRKLTSAPSQGGSGLYFSYNLEDLLGLVPPFRLDGP